VKEIWHNTTAARHPVTHLQYRIRYSVIILIWILEEYVVTMRDKRRYISIVSKGGSSC